ncbi:hypothetical protein K449DRAFT_427638 [Hypoxylon sp. EC38]|nr:hypothetical protein K449DRAFT_427638 [Hypoxylon sp. EC38]
MRVSSQVYIHIFDLTLTERSLLRKLHEVDPCLERFWGEASRQIAGYCRRSSPRRKLITTATTKSWTSTSVLPDADDCGMAQDRLRCSGYIGTSFAKAQKSKATWHRKSFNSLIDQLMEDSRIGFSLPLPTRTLPVPRKDLDRHVREAWEDAETDTLNGLLGVDGHRFLKWDRAIDRVTSPNVVEWDRWTSVKPESGEQPSRILLVDAANSGTVIRPYLNWTSKGACLYILT